MLKKLKLFKFWIFNLFTFSKPVFLNLEYIDFVIDNKAIFQISWQIRKAYSIHIPELKFQSFKKHASAYIAVPNKVNQITIYISNSWGHQTETVTLLRTEMIDQTDFNIKPNFKEFNQNSVSIPEIKLHKKKPKIKVLNVEVIKINMPKIKNLNYSQN